MKSAHGWNNNQLAYLWERLSNPVFLALDTSPDINVTGPVKDHKALAELLACMGASRLSNNLNQLAKSANSGTLYFDFETKRDITRASDDIRNMRLLLMRALGMRLNDKHKRDESTSQSFARASLDERRYRL